MNEQNYRRAREAAGVKVEQVAVYLGVSPTTVYNWERGNTNPDADKVKAMAELYGVSPDFLLAVAQ